MFDFIRKRAKKVTPVHSQEGADFRPGAWADFDGMQGIKHDLMSRVKDGELAVRITGQELTISSSPATQEKQAENSFSSTGRELSLLIDHLSLVREENQELVKMTQQSIEKISELSHALIESKDQIIQTKNNEIQNLNVKLTSQETELKMLSREVENLKTLVASLEN